MDVALLRAFLVVAEERHFARAAKRLDLSAPALSQQIRKLEAIAGVPLFERHPFGLTPSGESMLETAAEAVRAADVAARRLAALATGSQPTLRIGVLSHGAGALTAAAIRAFRREEPGVAVTVRGIDFPDVISAVTERLVDVAFVRPTLDDARLDEHPLGSELRFAILPRWDDRAHLPSVSLDDLDRDRFLSPADGTPTPYRRYLHLVDDRNGEPPCCRESQCRRAEEFLTAVGAGLGVATTISSFRAYYAWPGIAYVPIAGTTPSATSVVVAADDRRALVRRFCARTEALAGSLQHRSAQGKDRP